MAYLPNYKWDIFISYAHADNGESGRARRWITSFYTRLKEEVQKNLRGQVELFFDQREQRAYNTINSIHAEVKNSALFLVMGSPHWVQSEDWCQEELKTFLQHRPDTTRVFVAELEPPEDDIRYPDMLPGNLRRRFWKKSRNAELPITLKPSDDAYEELLKLLAKEIRERLRMLKNDSAPRPVATDAPAAHDAAAPASIAPALADSGAAAPSAVTPGPVAADAAPKEQAAPPPRPVLASKILAGQSVYVADGPSDVESERGEIISYLKDFGVSVVEMPRPSPETVEEYEAALDRCLKERGCYLQLLGRRACRPLPGSVESPTYLQLNRAVARKMDLFLWLPDDLDPTKNPDTKYRECLESARNGSHVPDLAKAVMTRLEERLKEEERVPQRPGELVRLVINVDPADKAKAKELIFACRGRKCRAILDDFELNEVARAEWIDADAVAFLHGEAPRPWLPARYNAFTRERANKGLREPEVEAVIYAPPAPKETGEVGGGNLYEIDLSESWDIEKFKAWLDGIGIAETQGQ